MLHSWFSSFRDRDYECNRSIRRQKDHPKMIISWLLRTNQIRWFHFSISLTCSYATKVEKMEKVSHSQPLMKSSSKSSGLGILFRNRMDSVLYTREEGNKPNKMSSSFLDHLGAVRDESLMHGFEWEKEVRNPARAAIAVYELSGISESVRFCLSCESKNFTRRLQKHPTRRSEASISFGSLHVIAVYAFFVWFIVVRPPRGGVEMEKVGCAGNSASKQDERKLALYHHAIKLLRNRCTLPLIFLFCPLDFEMKKGTKSVEIGRQVSRFRGRRISTTTTKIKSE